MSDDPKKRKNKGSRILYIDDQIFMLYALRLQLEKRGLLIEVCQSGQAALEFLLALQKDQ